MIKEYRKKHIWAVAELMEKYGVERGFCQEKCQEMYILGVLHDIGYAFLEEKDFIKHNVVGGGDFESPRLQILERGVLSRGC